MRDRCTCISNAALSVGVIYTLHCSTLDSCDSMMHMRGERWIHYTPDELPRCDVPAALVKAR